MATPAPAADDLHKKLIALDPDERQEIERILWRLRSLHRHAPQDIRVNVAIIYACLMLGRRAEAIELAKRIRGTQQGQDIGSKANLAVALVRLGLYPRAKSIFCDLLVSAVARVRSEIVDNAIMCALCSGDTGWLRDLVAIDRSGRAGRLIARIEASGLAAYFLDHQRIVHDVVGGWQCAAEVMAVEDIADTPTVFTFLTLSTDRASRAALYADIETRLERFYAAKGEAPGTYLPYFSTVLRILPDNQAHEAA